MTQDQVDLFLGAAKAALGTAFHHQGRSAGVGLDCIGLVVVALKATGIEVRDRSDYARRPDGKSLVAALEEHGAVRQEDMQAGDVLVFQYDHQPQHVAIVSREGMMIHSFAPAGKVVETSIGGYWRRRLIAIYRFV